MGELQVPKFSFSFSSQQERNIQRIMHKIWCFCRGKSSVDTRSIDFAEGIGTPYVPETAALGEASGQELVDAIFLHGKSRSTERKGGIHCGVREGGEGRYSELSLPSRRRINGKPGAQLDLVAEKLGEQEDPRSIRDGSLAGDKAGLAEAEQCLRPERPLDQTRKSKTGSLLDLALSSNSSEGLQTAQVEVAEDRSDTSCSQGPLVGHGNQSNGSPGSRHLASQNVERGPLETVGSAVSRLSSTSTVSDANRHQGSCLAKSIPSLDLSQVRRTGSYCANVFSEMSAAMGHIVNDTPRKLQQWQIDLNLRWVGEDDDDLVAEVRLTDDPTPRTQRIGEILSNQNPPVLSTGHTGEVESADEDESGTPGLGGVPKNIVDAVDRFLFVLKTPAPHRRPAPETRKPLQAAPHRQNNNALDPESAPHEIQDDIADVQAMRSVMMKRENTVSTHTRQPSSLRRQVILDDMKTQLSRLGSLLGSTTGSKGAGQDGRTQVACDMDLEKAILEDVRLEVMRLEEELTHMGRSIERPPLSKNASGEAPKKAARDSPQQAKPGKQDGRLNKDKNQSIHAARPGNGRRNVPRRVSKQKSQSKMSPKNSKLPRFPQQPCSN